MTRASEIRDRLADDPQIELWIMDLLSRLPMEEAQPDTPAYRFAETVKITRARMRHGASEPWFDRSTPTNVPDPESRVSSPVTVHYPPENQGPGRRSFIRRAVNRIVALWWLCTGRGTAGVAWSIE